MAKIFTYEEIERTLYLKMLRLATSMGYAVDITQYQPRNGANETAYLTARQDVLDAGNELIDVFNISEADSRGEKLVNRIVINLRSIDPGSVYHSGETYYDEVSPNHYDTKTVEGGLQVLRYDIRSVTKSAKYDRICRQIILGALTNSKATISTVKDDYTFDTNKNFLIQHIGSTDVNQTDFLERLYTFDVTDVWIDEFDTSTIETGIVPLQTVTGYGVATNPDGSETDGKVVVQAGFIYQNMYSMFFDGFDERIDVGGDTELTFASGGSDLPFSFELWVKPINTGSIMTLISKQGVSNVQDEYTLRIDATGTVRVVCFGGDNSINIRANTNGSISYGVWSQIIATYDGSQSSSGFKIYINGVDQALTLGSGGVYVGMSNFPNPVVLAGRLSGTNSYRGNLDEFRIYNQVLTPAQVGVLYNSGTPVNPDSISSLIYNNQLGDGAEFTSGNWYLPDLKNLLTDAVSVNMEEVDRSIDVP